MTCADFIPNPSPYRDYLAGSITAEEFLSATDEEQDSWSGPTRWTYDDWYAGALSWAANNSELHLYEFQIVQFADLTAWALEGANIIPGSFEQAWEHFTSGLSGGPHHVPLDGHDLNLWHDHLKIRARGDMASHAASRGLCDVEITRLLRAWEPYLDTFMHIHEEDLEEYVTYWLKGFHPDSPHRVPLDVENEKARKRERLRVSKLDCYRGIRRWEELAKYERPNFPVKTWDRFTLAH